MSVFECLCEQLLIANLKKIVPPPNFNNIKNAPFNRNALYQKID